jgi:hypothetical protein
LPATLSRTQRYVVHVVYVVYWRVSIWRVERRIMTLVAGRRRTRRAARAASAWFSRGPELLETGIGQLVGVAPLLTGYALLMNLCGTS